MGLAAVGIILALLIPASASVGKAAVTPKVFRTYSIPFTKYGAYPWNTSSNSTSGCVGTGGGLSWATHPAVSLKTGRVSFHAIETLSPCITPGTINAYATLGYQKLYITVPSKGIYWLHYTWNLSYNTSFKVTSNGSSTNQTGYWFIALTMRWADNYSGSWYRPTVAQGSPTNSTSAGRTDVNFTFGKPPVPLRDGHTYVIWSVLRVFLQATTTKLPPGSAVQASLDLNPAGSSGSRFVSVFLVK
jgi:hypothetical protein